MKRTVFFLLITINFSVLAQGQHAGKFATLIGKKYKTESDIAPLKSFNYRGGNVIGEINENAPFNTVFEIFTTKNTAVVLFSKLSDLKTNQYVILDVLYFTKMPKDFEIKTIGCSIKNQNPDEPIVAAVKPNGVTVLKAYQLKVIRFNQIAIKIVKCINEIDD